MSSVLTETTPSNAAEQRQQVQLALQPQIMATYLQQLLDEPDTRHTPECRILDMKYEPGDYCTILYQLGERMVIGTFRWGKAKGELPATARLIEPLGMQIYRFEHDPALPGLATALDGPAMARLLEQALPEYRDGGARILRCRVTPLRYRPGRRCTLRFDIALRDGRTGMLGRRRLFGKVYHDFDRAAEIERDMRKLADSAPARAGQVILAPVAAFLPDLRIIMQEPVDGVPLELYLEGLAGEATAGDQRGWDGIIRSAAAFAAVHTAGLTTDTTFDLSIETELKRFAKRAAQAARVDAAVGARLQELAEALPTWRGLMPAWGETFGLAHGDCKHSQCMLTPAGVAILDFDHCGMSDPAADIGTYLATLRQLGIRQSLKARGGAAAEARTRWLRALEDRFLDAYVEASGFGDHFRLRASWYEAVALMRKALRGFARSPRSLMPLAQVEEAWRVLATLPRG
jgi:hypothetical protein